MDWIDLENWKPLFELMARSYANASYLVSEENHNQAEEDNALEEMVSYISRLLEAQKAELVEEIISDIPKILSVEVGFSVTKKNLVKQLRDKYLNK
jgi:ribosomal protein S7